MNASPRQRIERRILVDETTGCWNWTGYVNDDGYGTIRYEYVGYLAHRFVYQHLRGPIPEGCVLDHVCRNRRCVNPSPEHLEVVTQAENLVRGEHRNYITHRTKVCKRGHQIEGHNALLRADGRARCRTCHNESARASQQRRRARK